MEGSWHILALPKELQRVIFEMLPLRVLARSQQVCKQWNNEALSSLKSLTMNDAKITSQGFSSIVSKLSPQQFKHLKLGAEAFIWDLTALSRLTHLSSLDIHNSPSLSASPFTDAIAQLSHLQTIRMYRSLIAPDRALPAIAKHLPKLTQLSLVYVEDDVELKDMRHVLQMTNLTSLNLECSKISLDDEFILTLATRLTKLDSLQLSNAHVSESLTALSRLSQLTRLVVPHSFFGAQSPSFLPCKLVQIEAQFSDESLETLAAQCSNLTSLIIASRVSLSSTDMPAVKPTDASLNSIAKLVDLSSLSIGFSVPEDSLLCLQHLTNLKYLTVSKLSTAALKEKLKLNMPNLQYINADYIVRAEDSSDPYIKYSNHFQCELHNGIVKSLTSFSDKLCFVACIDNKIWIQGRNDLIVCKGVVSELLVSNRNDYLLLCDAQGQYGCFSVESDDFMNYVDPVTSSFSCLALADNQRFIVAGTNKGEFILLNTLGMLKATIQLVKSADDTPVNGPILRMYFKPDKNVVLGVVPDGIFSWDFDAEQPSFSAFVKTTTRTITACAYIREMDLIVAGDTQGLVTLSSSESLDFPEKFQCDAPIVALATHPNQPLIAIATETEIIIWGITGGEFRVLHSSLPIGAAKCTAIAWAKTGGVLFAGYNNGTVVEFVKCSKSDVIKEEETKPLDEVRVMYGDIIYVFAEECLIAAKKNQYLAGKLTGMLLEMDLAEVELMTKDKHWLTENLNKALEVLERQSTQEENI